MHFIVNLQSDDAFFCRKNCEKMLKLNVSAIVTKIICNQCGVFGSVVMANIKGQFKCLDNCWNNNAVIFVKNIRSERCSYLVTCKLIIFCIYYCRDLNSIFIFTLVHSIIQVVNTQYQFIILIIYTIIIFNGEIINQCHVFL